MKYGYLMTLIANMSSTIQTHPNLGSTTLVPQNTVPLSQTTLAVTALLNQVPMDAFYATSSITLTNQVATSTFETMIPKTSGLPHGNLLVKTLKTTTVNATMVWATLK